jgi:hypothetical protein
MEKMMIASQENLKVGNTIVFKCDEYRNDNPEEFDGQIQLIDKEGVHVLYLSGHKSRKDHIPWTDILAKLDKRKPYIKLSNASYSGHFKEFNVANKE